MIDSIKHLDPIMHDIENNKLLYEVPAIDANIDEEKIVPGISGFKINIDKSYQIMKKYGKFDDNLLVIEEVSPNLSLNNYYDKYISFGNSRSNNVSLIFKIENANYLEEIVEILHEKGVTGTFFVDDIFLKNNQDMIKLLYLNNQKIEYLSHNSENLSSSINEINQVLKSYVNQSLSYCYSDNLNNDLLKACASKKLHTIIPSVNTDKFPYYELKDKIQNGSIISLENNAQIVEELKYIINYIRQNNYKIVSLEKLLKE